MSQKRDRREAKKDAERLAARFRRAHAYVGIDTSDPTIEPPYDAIMADWQALAHNNTNGPLPRFYVDQLVTCRQCGTIEVWLAERQRWWYEIAKGDINTRAVLCRNCRRIERDHKAEARRVHLEGLARKQQQQASQANPGDV